MIFPKLQGAHSVKLREENRRRVWDFYHENPLSTQKEVAENLGVTPKTVGIHYRAIKAGWKPEGVE